MKHIIYPTLWGVLSFGSACTDLSVPVNSELTTDNFPETEEQYQSASGVAYSEFARGYCDNYWLVSELSGDASVIIANGSNWLDGGQYQQLHYHTWTDTHPGISSEWSWGYKTINTINKVFNLLNGAPKSDVKATSISELRTLRAYVYFILMNDFWGVPIMLEFGQPLKARDTREDIYNFIENEIKESIPNLSRKNDVSTWGRPTQPMAYTLLAKLYLNSSIYINKQKYNECVASCDSIIMFENMGETGLTKRSKYLKI